MGTGFVAGAVTRWQLVRLLDCVAQVCIRGLKNPRTSLVYPNIIKANFK